MPWHGGSPVERPLLRWTMRSRGWTREIRWLDACQPLGRWVAPYHWTARTGCGGALIAWSGAPGRAVGRCRKGSLAAAQACPVSLKTVDQQHSG
eukprot:354470-Chlamydomonas_euryale.AAC.19